MKTVTLTHTDTRTGPLVLVNAGHPLAAQRNPHLAYMGPDPAGNKVLLDVQAAKMMARLIAACGGSGEIIPVSGFRSHGEQIAIFEDTLREKGEEFTRRFVALPGCSEHETGLALDVTAASEAYDFICPAFPGDGVYAEFRRLAALYGFIERYPKGKTEITGIGHEPWHFRYVGWPHAGSMVENGWTLEEYIDVLAHRTGPENALVRQEREYAVHSYTVAPAPGEELAVPLPEGAPYQLSGNNAGGVVVTIWK